jgi:epsilon-lactone hydrolase
MANLEIENLKNMFASSRQARAEGQRSDVHEMRALYNQLSSFFPIGKDVKVESLSINGVPAERITPEGALETKVLLYFHGGGYAIGGLESHRTLVADLARASARTGILFDYRLAPENSFPAPLEDALSTYRWLLEQDVAADDIVFAGDSAGGGMVIATLVKLRGEGIALPRKALCISPWVDLELKGESHQSKQNDDPIVNKEDLLNWVDIYLKGEDPANPMASPVNADLSGLPPLLIQVGTAEVLLDDSRTLAKNAQAAGVDVVLMEWDEMIHVWHQYAAVIRDGVQAIAQAGAFLKAE